MRARAEASPETDIDFVRAIREGVQGAPITRDEYIDQLRDMSRGGPVPDQVRNFPGDITGVNSMVAGARAFAQGDVQGGIINSGLGAITGLTFGAGTSRLRPRPPRAVFPNVPQTRFPSPPPRDIGRASDGSVLPVAHSRPFRNSFRGGNDDLVEAAAMRARPQRAPIAANVTPAVSRQRLTEGAGSRASDLRALANRMAGVGSEVDAETTAMVRSIIEKMNATGRLTQAEREVYDQVLRAVRNNKMNNYLSGGSGPRLTTPFDDLFDDATNGGRSGGGGGG